MNKDFQLIFFFLNLHRVQFQKYIKIDTYLFNKPPIASLYNSIGDNPINLENEKQDFCSFTHPEKNIKYTR